MSGSINSIFSNKEPSEIYKGVGGTLAIIGIVLAALGGIALFQHYPFSQTMMEVIKYEGCMTVFVGGNAFIVIGLTCAGYGQILEPREKETEKD